MASKYVNVYDMSRHYGGPEEGGWWYDVGEIIEIHGPMPLAKAEALKEQLEDEYPATGKRFSVLGGDDYLIRIENNKGMDFSNWQRWE